MPEETGSNARLKLPRTLVTHLLREAQTKGPTSGFLLGKTGMALHCAPLASDADVRTALAAHTEPPFAFYRASPGLTHGPALEDLAALTGVVDCYLGISLDTKGVLQLRAWRLTGGQAAPLDVAIVESETAHGGKFTAP